MTDKIYIYSITSDQRKIPFQSKNDYFSEKNAQEAAVEYAATHFSKDTGVHIEVTEMDGDMSWVVLREDYLMEVLDAGSYDGLVSLLKKRISFTPWEVEKVLEVISALAVISSNDKRDYARFMRMGDVFKSLVIEPILTKEEEEEMISIGMQITEAGNYSEADVKRHAELAAKAGVSQC